MTKGGSEALTLVMSRELSWPSLDGPVRTIASWGGLTLDADADEPVVVEGSREGMESVRSIKLCLRAVMRRWAASRTAVAWRKFA